MCFSRCVMLSVKCVSFLSKSQVGLLPLPLLLLVVHPHQELLRVRLPQDHRRHLRAREDPLPLDPQARPFQPSLE